MNTQKTLHHFKEELVDTRAMFFERRFWLAILTLVLGNMAVSVAINSIMLPENFFSGGLTGIAMAVYYVIDFFSLGNIYFLLNIPILLLAWGGVSFRLLIISLIGSTILYFCMEYIPPVDILPENRFMSSLFAGIIIGSGSGLYLRFGGSVGGLDIIGMYFKKKYSLPIGNTFIIANSFIILVAFFLYDLNTALYSFVTMYATAYCLGKIQVGFSQRRSVHIITENTEAVSEHVMKKLDRGFTLLNAEGGYAHKSIKIIYTVINLVELGRLKEMLIRVDPKAFVVINPASEVIGNKFLTWQESGYSLPKTQNPPQNGERD